MAELAELAKGVEEFVLDIRRHLHANPELRFQEDETLNFISETVKGRMKFGFATPIGSHYNGGIAYDFTFDNDYDRILFRADVDALPVPEETGLPFASTVPGVSHACGHDVNAAILLGVMELIAEDAITPKHNIRFVFQRAEENPITESGGAMLVREGVLEGISKAYALHPFTENKAPAGQFQTRRGGMLSNSGRVKIEVNCASPVAALPHIKSNACYVMADLMIRLRHFPITYLGPLEPISFVPASVSAGELNVADGLAIEVKCKGGHVAMPHNGSNASDILTDLIVGLLHILPIKPTYASAGESNASNVRPGKATLHYVFPDTLSTDMAEKMIKAINTRVMAIVSAYPDATVSIVHYHNRKKYAEPEKATLWYAFRHLLSPEKTEKTREAINIRIKAIVSAFPGAEVSIEHFAGHPALINDPAATESVMRLLTEAGEDVIEIDPVFGGEDFAHYLAQVPGNMMMLGAWQEGCGGHHTATFNPDESVFWKGVLYWLLLATN